MNVSMNSTMNSAMHNAANPASGAVSANPAAEGAAPAAAPGAPAVVDPALAAALPHPAVLDRAFQQWLGLDAALPPAEAPAAELPPDGAGSADAEAATPAAPQGEPLLAAMTMTLPMMPAALPAMMMAMPGGAPAGAPAAAGLAPALPAGLPAADLPESAPTLPAGGALPMPALDSPASQLARQAGAAQAAGQAAAPAPAPAAAAATPAAASAAAAPVAAADARASAAPADALGAGFGLNAPAAPAAAQRGADTVALAGPPTAWRQTLQEALGERLQLTSGKNVDQAVIRLEPPNLGRIDISIRHAAGSLEVNISATHGEVLRQLNSVSENLRSDLAQRQTGEVSVNVTQAARPQAGAQAGHQAGADAQGRGRQQNQEQDRAPGAGLREASADGALFSMNG